MTLIKNNHPERDIFGKRFSDIMDEFFSDAAATTHNSFAPKVDLSENEKQFVIEAEVPGMDKKDIRINVEKNMLTISGERVFEKEEENRQYHRVESRYGSFSRSLTLPENADVDSIQAVYNNGILSITIDKNEKSLKRQIDIK